MARFIAAGPTHPKHQPTKDFEPIRAVSGPTPLSKIYYKPSIEGEELTDEFKEELRQNLPALSMVLEEQSLIIPGEIFLLIGEHCDIFSLIYLSQSCKQLYNLFSNQYYWRSLYMQRFGQAPLMYHQMIDSQGWKQVVIRKEKFLYYSSLYKDTDFSVPAENETIFKYEVQPTQGLLKPLELKVPEHWEHLQGPGLYPVDVRLSTRRFGGETIEWYSYGPMRRL